MKVRFTASTWRFTATLSVILLVSTYRMFQMWLASDIVAGQSPWRAVKITPKPTARKKIPPALLRKINLRY
ncbi:hypothetical protein GGS24DRAFT_446034 [Hypoxylon argillaceum]|nr:hypothetical protein GGS24DRAFT_446034 [Hypoxylon argillaceum]